MCGFIAIFNNKKINFNDEDFSTLLKSIIHRGPNNTGIFREENIAMGLNRLSIQDLGEAANQPMLSQNGRYIIVFNGEIYNYKKLKNDYFKNFKFKTNSDTEVLLEGFVKYGKFFFELLCGMWSVVIYDKEEKQLIISRDRLGIKPLYLSKYDDTWIFSSEQKVILNYFNKKKININFNNNYLKNYIIFANTNFENKTLYKNILSINPGTYCEVKDDFYNQEKIWNAIEQIEGKKVDSSYDFGDGLSSKRFFDIISEDKVWDINLQKYFVEMNNED